MALRQNQFIHKYTISDDHHKLSSRIHMHKKNGMKFFICSALLAFTVSVFLEDDTTFFVNNDKPSLRVHDVSLSSPLFGDDGRPMEVHRLLQDENIVKEAAAQSIKQTLLGKDDEQSSIPSEAIGNTNEVSEQNILQLSPYTLENIKLTLPTFYRELFLVYYDPQEDEFLIYIDEKKDKWVPPNRNRVNLIIPSLAYALRSHFGERFQGNSSDDFFMLVSSGDEPKLACECVGKESRLENPGFCQNELFAPILQFGSVYRDQEILPNMVTMPVWHHMTCFRQWQQYKKVCNPWRLLGATAGLLGGEDALGIMSDDMLGEEGGEDNESALAESSSSSTWDKLVPQIIWRGSDFGFLHCIYRGREHIVRSAQFENDVAPRIAQFGHHARGVASSLLETWKNLTPRWKGFALTAMAELDALESNAHDEEHDGIAQNEFPWIDSRFTLRTSAFGKPVDSNKSKSLYVPFQDYGIQPVGERMSTSELSRYKYHIDFGGGGKSFFYFSKL